MPRNQITFPKTTPQWLRLEISNLYNRIDRLERDQECLRKQLGKTQEDFQDLFDLVQRIAEEREPSVRRACIKMIQRFYPGSYEEGIDSH